MSSDLDVGSLVIDNAGNTTIELRSAITEATLTRTIDSSPTLELVVEDTKRTLLKSGAFTKRIRVHVDDHDFEIAQVKKHGDEITITFEDLAIAELRRHNSPTAPVAAGTITRVDFVKQLLAAETNWIKLYVDPEVKPNIAQVQLSRGSVSSSASGEANPNYPGPAAAGGGNATATAATLPSKGIGALSADQKTFAIGVASGTGLAFLTVVAWIGAESGWNTTKSGHNYLNIGPGRGYPDVQAAVKATISVINQKNMSGIRASVSQNASAQVAAIAAAPWDAGHYAKPGGGTTIATILQQLGGASATGTGTTGGTATGGSPATQTQLEDSWTCFKRIFGEINWRIYADKGNLYAGPDYAFIDKDPIVTFKEFQGGVDNIDFDFDTGKPVSTTTIYCRADRWICPPGSVISIPGMNLTEKWICSSIKRSLFSHQTTIIASSPQAEYPEPVASSSYTEGAGAPGSGSPTTVTGAASDGVYIWPVASHTVTSPFGDGRNHQGIDIGVSSGTSVVASRGGVVQLAGNVNPSGYGNQVIIKHPDGDETYYAHLRSFSCRAGLTVAQGQEVGKSGGGANDPGKGDARGAHLHFEIRHGGKPIDPLQRLSDTAAKPLVVGNNQTAIVEPNGNGGVTIFTNNIPTF